MLTHRFPYPPNRGDRIRSYNLLRVLSEEFRVTLCSTTDEPISPHDLAHVQSLCESVLVAPLGRYQRTCRGLKSFAIGKSLTEGMFASPNLSRHIKRCHQQRPFDAVLVFCSSMYPYVDNQAFDGTPTVVDLVDVDSQKWRQMSRESHFHKKFLYAAESTRVQRLEQRIADRASAVSLVSEAEAELFRQTTAVTKPTYGISNGVDTEYFSPPSAATCLASRRLQHATRLSLVFTGVLDYAPNVDGMVWFCRQVLPQLSREVDFQLSIVGRRPCRRILDLDAIPGVDVVGEVPDVRPYLRRADVAISPLKLARGIQNKVLEAMAMGLPVVLSPQSAEGIGAVSGNEFLIADSVDQWCTTLHALAADLNARTRIAEAARQLVCSEFSWPTRLACFVSLLESSIQSTHAAPVSCPLNSHPADTHCTPGNNRPPHALC